MATTPERSLRVRAIATRALARSFIALSALAFITVIACAQSQTLPNPAPMPATTAPGLEPASSPTNTEAPSTTPTTTVTRAPSPSEELNTLLMHATFLISGPTKVPGQLSFGTVFIMGVPYKDNPKIAHIVLVTAAHVLEGIAGDNAVLQLRRRNDDGTYTAFPYQLPIRKNDQPLYVRHQTADVVAMYADLPDEVPMTGLPPDALVTDKTLEDIEIHPGDDAFVLGFPLAV